MPPKAASLRSISGSGYSVEDHVGAYFALSLLGGDAPLSAELGEVTRLDFYTRTLGWFNDDQLVTFIGGQRLSLSVKSSRQVTGSEVPNDFVSASWDQFLHEGSNVFDPARDYMGLVSSSVTPQVREALDDLLLWANWQDDEKFRLHLQHRGTGSQIKRTLFKSLSCPDQLQTKRSVSEAETVGLLRRLRFLSLDFRTPSSPTMLEALRKCQLVLRDGSVSSAAKLYDAITRAVRTVRENGGYLDLPRLIKSLDGEFELRQWPQVAGDLAAIGTWSRAQSDRINDKIGWQVHLPRTADIKKLSNALHTDKLVALTGVSGCGKSVLVKTWTQTLEQDVPVLWLDGASLQRDGLDGVLRNMNLHNDLPRIGATLTCDQAYCVIDGAGAISLVNGYRDIVEIIRRLNVLAEASPWHVLLVCQREEWLRLLHEMNRVNTKPLTWNRLHIGVPDRAKELETVWTAFPQLRPLSLQRDLHTLLLRPKILDLAAIHLASGHAIDTNEWIGETSIARWFWQECIQIGPSAIARAQAALAIAERQADAVSSELTINQLPAGADELRGDNILVLRDLTVGFQHDLYGDWTRLHILLGHRSDLGSFVGPRLVSPFWNRAVRLLGLHLLEGPNGADEWKRAVVALDSDTTEGNVGQDLLLEAVIFAANPLPLLTAIWPILCEDDGRLLNRLLTRFLYVATEPNPHALSLAETSVDHIRYSTFNRWPYWPYWLPMLRMLNEHKDVAVALASEPIAEIANSWLRLTPLDYPNRIEAAQLGIAVSERTLANEWTYAFETKDASVTAMRAGLAAVHELPETVALLIRRGCGRSERIARPNRHSYDEDDPHIAAQRPFTLRRNPNYGPWPDGQRQEPNEAFARVCFEGNGLHPIIDEYPELAAEALLATLIALPPKYERTDEVTGFLQDREYGLDNDYGHRHSPPFYDHQPWMYFLRVHPAIAISTIVKLVNFCSERAADVFETAKGVRPLIRCKLPGEPKVRVWTASPQCHTWHLGVDGSDAVSSVLMTLEFWLYDEMDQGHEIEQWLKQIKREGTTFALLALLGTVACKYPQLAEGSLAFLMAIPELLYVEREKVMDRHASTAMIAWTMKSNSQCAAARAWHSMVHRKVGLDTIAHRLFLTHLPSRQFLEKSRTEWERQSKRYRRQGQAEAADALDRLIAGFTISNYTAEYSDEHNRIVISHHFPEPLAQVAGQAVAEAEFGILTIHFPIQCRRILNGEHDISSDDEIDRLWNDAHRLLATDLAHPEMIAHQDIICAAAAVLLVKCDTWLDQYPDRRHWCIDGIKSSIQSPPAEHFMDSDVDVSNSRWHSFCAQVLPRLWAEEPKNEELRLYVVLLALDKHYSTVQLLFKSAFDVRETLRDDFQRLQVLGRQWAKERIILFRREDMANNGWVLCPEERRSFRAIVELGDEAINALLSPEFLLVVDAFIDGSLGVALPGLQPETLKAEINWSGHDHPRERRRMSSETDTHYIQAMYAFLPALEMATSPVERSIWIGLWTELWNGLIRTLQPQLAEDVDKDVSGLPHQIDRWTLGCGAVLIYQMEDDEHPERIWVPLFDLAGHAHHWLEYFMRDYFSYNLSATNTQQGRKRFIKRWHAMIDYASTSPSWDLERSRRWHVTQNWEHLLGMHLDYHSDPWPEEYEAVVTATGHYFERFLAVRQNANTIGTVLRHLRRPAACKLRSRSLVWFAPHLISAADFFWEDRSSVPLHLGLLLADCWQNRRDELVTANGTLSCFHKLVKVLADIQDPVGLELQNRVIAG